MLARRIPCRCRPGLRIYRTLRHAAREGIDFCPCRCRRFVAKLLLSLPDTCGNVAAGRRRLSSSAVRSETLLGAWLCWPHFIVPPHRKREINRKPFCASDCCAVQRLDALLGGGLRQIERSIQPGDWPELAPARLRIVNLPRRQPQTSTTSPRTAVRGVCRTATGHSATSGTTMSCSPGRKRHRHRRLWGDAHRHRRRRYRAAGRFAGRRRRLVRHAAIAAYESVRPLTHTERELVSPLDHSGTLIGAINWLDWIYREDRQFVQIPSRRILARLDVMSARMERENRNNRERLRCHGLPVSAATRLRCLTTLAHSRFMRPGPADRQIAVTS